MQSAGLSPAPITGLIQCVVVRGGHAEPGKVIEVEEANFSSGSTGREARCADLATPVTERPCSCRAWGLLGRLSRDLLLDDLMEWAKLLHQVQLILLLYGEHVVVRELSAPQSDLREVRRVLTELCSWGDCADVVLELTPSHRWGFDLQLLTRLCVSLGFEPNGEPQQFVPEAMIRHPTRGRCHIRL